MATLKFDNKALSAFNELKHYYIAIWIVCNFLGNVSDVVGQITFIYG